MSYRGVLNDLKDLIENGVYLFVRGYSELFNIRSIDITSSTDSHKPLLTLLYDDEIEIANYWTVSPASGYIDSSKEKLFSWDLQRTYATINDAFSNFTAYIDWRTSDSGNITSINCGSATSYTVPAGTFPRGATSLQWRVRHSSGDIAYVSDWYTFTTAESTPEATPIAPRNTIEDGNKDISLDWSYRISTGTEQAAYQVQWSRDKTSWETSGEVLSPDTSYVIPGETLVSGSWFWRVRAKNSTGVWSDYSDIVMFTVIASPKVLGVSATQDASPVISWQCSEQNAYQVIIPGIFDSGMVYGMQTTFDFRKIIPDGSYIVQVRVQSKYGVYSDFVSAPLNISHLSGGDILLNATTEEDKVNLSWATEDSYSAFIVYRNGKAIAKTESNYYTDKYAYGTAEYYVYGLKSSDRNYYGTSNSAVVSIDFDYPVLIVENTGEAVKLTNSDVQTRTVDLQEDRTYTSTIIYKQKYPVYEMSDNYTASLSVIAAFKNGDPDIDAMLNLAGKPVCLKHKLYGSVYGIVSSFTISRNDFYTRFSFYVWKTNHDVEVEI